MAVRASQVLIVTADPELLDDLLRLTAEVHVVADVAPDPTAARPWYQHAPQVLVGIDLADACVRAGLPRRAGVVLVGHAPGGVLPDWGVAERLGADHVAVLPAAESWLLERFATIGTAIDTGGIVAVLGGRGGAGASVLAGGLAVTAARRGLRTLLVDADPLGGGVDLVLGWESLDGLRWPALSQASGRVHPPALVDALPGRAELVILSWDRGDPVTIPPEAMLAALDAGRRGRDVTVVDLPRRLDEAAALALRSADRAYLVVPAELRACAAAARVAATAVPHCPALALVVRQPGPGRLSVRDVADALRLPVAGTLRTEPRLSAALERGEPPAGGGRGPLADLCATLLEELAGLRGAA
ncbi:MAG TPA: septum site-determining protein Ssd [Micromonosporaceae bacterium]|nr:septum site-determining protein Ssd [Micromonosporaceae bacterium]